MKIAQKNTGFRVVKPSLQGKKKDGIRYYRASVYCNGMHVNRESTSKESCMSWINAFVGLVNNYIISDNMRLSDAFIKARDVLKQDIYSYKSVKINLPVDIDIYQQSFTFDEHKSNPNAERLKSIPVKEHGQYTYVIENPNNGEYKIGKSKNLYKRFIAMSSATYRMIMYCDKDIESILHKVFSDKRIRDNNEWFKLDKDDLELLRDVYEFKFC